MQEIFRQALALIRAKGRKEIPPFTAEEKEQLLKKYHPDNSKLGKTQLSFGPNQGQWLPSELVKLIEEKRTYPPLLEEEKIDLLIVGGGGAGICAALEAARFDLKITLITKDKLGASNTVLAQGGMAVALGADDDPLSHAQDTLQGGERNNPELVEILAQEGKEQVYWLEALGMNFDRTPEGDYALSAGGGHSRKRIAGNKALIGPALMKVLLTALHQTTCEVKPFHELLDLLLNEQGHCGGAIVYDRHQGKYKFFKAQAVILATGGLGALEPCGYPTTNHPSVRGEGLAAAYRAGVGLVDMDSLQFHPTGVVWPLTARGHLASEMIRSQGAGLYNALGEPFVNSLETRNVVTAAMIKELVEGRGVALPSGGQGIWLDTPSIPYEIFTRLFAKSFHTLSRQGYNPTEVPMLIVPTQHYQNGGIIIDKNGRTSLKGLWAAGEVTGGVHGCNRLGGNALTDVIVFGRRAGRDAAYTVSASPRT